MAASQQVTAGPAGLDHHFLKEAMPDPRLAGFQRSFGLPKRGAFSQFRRALPDGGCVHIRVYPRWYEVHWDRVDPRTSPFGHWWHDVKGGPATFLATVALLAGALWRPFR